MPHNIEDIIPPSRRQSFSERSRDVAEKTSEFIIERKKNSLKNSSKTHFAYTPAVVALFVIIVAITALFVFSAARVEIIPKTNTATITTELTATASSTGTLPFSLIKIDKRAMQKIPYTGTKTVSSIAHGTITIYNTRSVAQPLIKRTRFETLNGIIFRIGDKVLVPAKHMNNPGSITVPVYADKAGSKYNIAPSFFTVPGLANTSLADTIYAKSGITMSGGVSGIVPIISSKIETQTRTMLKKALSQSLLKDISSKIPSGYTLLIGGTYTTYTDLPNSLAISTNTKLATVQEDGKITAVIFPSLALAKNVASKIIATYDGISPVFIQKPQELVMKSIDSLPNDATQAFRFSLSGPVTIVWSVNKTRIAAAVAGRSRDDAKTIISTFPSVQKAYIVLRPFWFTTFPKDPNRITVLVIQPQ